MDDDNREAAITSLTLAATSDANVPSLKVVDALRWKVRKFLVDVPQDLTVREILDAIEEPIQLTEFIGVRDR